MQPKPLLQREVHLPREGPVLRVGYLFDAALDSGVEPDPGRGALFFFHWRARYFFPCALDKRALRLYLVHMRLRRETKKNEPTVARGVRWSADLYPRLVKATGKRGNFSALVNDLVRKALDFDEAA